MSEDDSWPLHKVLGIPASVITLLMGADWLWNKSAVITWFTSMVWSGLFIEVRFWHAITIGSLIYFARLIPWSDENRKEEETVEKAIENEESLSTESLKPIEYRADSIDGILYTWKWKNRGNGIYYITPSCPKCGMEMNRNSNFGKTKLECTKCGNEITIERDWDKNKDYIEKEVIRRIRTGEYKNQVTFDNLPLSD